MTNPLFPKFAASVTDKNRVNDSLKRIKRLVERPEPQARQQVVQEARSLRSKLRGKDRGLDDQLRKLIQAAEKNLATKQGTVSKIVSSVLGVLSGNKNVPRPIRSLVNGAIGPGSGDLEDAVNMTSTLIGQLAPQLFGDPTERQSPEQAGGVRTEPTAPRRIQPDQPETWHGMRLVDANHVEIRTRNFRGQYDINSPEITGAMVPVTSSNVHSIGFQMNLKNPLESVLLVRYLQKASGQSKAKVAGPTYGYAKVHPKLFRSFIQANSKGKFVWDELRIRGTVAGHQYRYTLLGIVGGNVPRRALIVNGIQILKRRSKVSRDGKRRVQSSKRSTVIGPYRPTSNRPNTGNPNRIHPRGR